METSNTQYKITMRHKCFLYFSVVTSTALLLFSSSDNCCLAYLTNKSGMRRTQCNNALIQQIIHEQDNLTKMSVSTNLAYSVHDIPWNVNSDWLRAGTFLSHNLFQKHILKWSSIYLVGTVFCQHGSALFQLWILISHYIFDTNLKLSLQIRL